MAILDQQYQVRHLIDDYLCYLRFEQAKPISAQTYETHLKRFTKYKDLIGDRDVRSLAPSDVNLIRMQMLERNCKVSYIGTFLGLLRTFLKYCKEEKSLEVMDYQKIRLPRGAQSSVEYLNDEELERFVNAIDVQNIFELRFKACLTGFLDTGMRISELLSVDRETIDWETGLAYIIGKGSKKRLVKFRTWSLFWIKKYLEVRTDDHPAIFVTHNPQNPTTRIVPEDMRRYFRIIAKRAGLRRVIPHMMRKTFATHFRKNGGDTRDIQKWLGHSRISTTERYLGTDWEELKKSHEKCVHYGKVEEVHAEVNVSFWSKNGKWAECIACHKNDKPHSARGYCVPCYVRRWRKGMLKGKPLQATGSYDKIGVYEKETSLLHPVSRVL